MKNKRNTYILLILVLAIWGLVIYQFFSFGSNDIQPDIVPENFKVKHLAVKERDTFTINVNYRDPFLGKMYVPDNKAKSPAIKVKRTKLKEVLVLPAIIYKGIVADNKNRKKVFMVIINNQRYLMSEKDTEQEITLAGGSSDFITVIYKGRRNKILLQE